MENIIKYQLKNECKMPDNVKKRVEVLNKLFFENDSEYLNKKTLPVKYKNEISSLYYDYVGNIFENMEWGSDFIKIEKSEWKASHRNKNEKYWMMAYILKWIANLPENPTIDNVFRELGCRKVSQIIFKNAYDRIKK